MMTQNVKNYIVFQITSMKRFIALMFWSIICLYIIFIYRRDTGEVHHIFNKGVHIEVTES